MEDIIEILKDINPDVNYETCETLIEDGILTSFELVMLVAELSQRFGVTIPPDQIIPENFGSARAINALIRRLEEEE